MPTMINADEQLRSAFNHENVRTRTERDYRLSLMLCAVFLLKKFDNVSSRSKNKKKISKVWSTAVCIKVSLTVKDFQDAM